MQIFTLEGLQFSLCSRAGHLLDLVRFLQTAGGLSKRTHPTLFSNRKAAIFFQGCLTNVDELLEDLLNRREAASSYGSDGEPMQLSHGDQGHISAQIILEMYLRTGSDSDRLAMLLSDLQVSLYAPRIWNLSLS